MDMVVKRKRGRPLGSGCGAISLIGKTIEAMQPGDRATFTREAELGDRRAISNLVHTIGSYVTRRIPKTSVSYETFETLTSQRHLIVGVIVTRKGGKRSVVATDEMVV